MKKIIRLLFLLFFIILCWPLFLYKKYGNTKIKLCPNTILVANHYSNIDPFLIKALFVKKKILFVATINVKKHFVSRFIAWLFDCVYVGSDSSNLTNFKKIITELKQGAILAIFPEGAVNPRRFGFFDFQAGVAFIAKKAKSTIVPLFIFPEFNFHKKSKIYIGEQIQYEEYAPLEDNTTIATYLLSKVMDLNAKMDEQHCVPSSE